MNYKGTRMKTEKQTQRWSYSGKWKRVDKR
jgi:hypothetical protein